jgi:hypothetical protein
MGVQFDRVLDAFDGPFERVEGTAPAPPGRVSGPAGRGGGFLLSHAPNDAFVAINRLLARGEEVYWLGPPKTDGAAPAGTIYVPEKASTAGAIRAIASERGLAFVAVAAPPAGDALKLKPVRVGIVDVYGGSMPSGWVQWLLTQFGFRFEVVYPPALDAGDLNARFDALVFEDGIVPTGRGEGRGGQIDPTTIPAEYRARIGAVTDAQTVPQLRRFLDAGGTIVAVGSSTSLASKLGLPVTNALVEEGTTTPLPPDKFYAPGCILQVHVDTSQPLAYGLPPQLDIFYSNNPLFRVQTGSGVRPIAWFEADDPLRSGWTWGGKYLKQAVAIAQADVGKGTLVLFGPLVAFRAHPHATFKFLFNGLYLGSAQPVTLPQ